MMIDKPGSDRPQHSKLNFAIFGHSIRSDWNHGNAHFLRGLVRALQGLGHRVTFYEARRNWSLDNLRRDHGDAPLIEFTARFPDIVMELYRPGLLQEPAALRAWLGETLAGVDVAIVHEWNEPDLVHAVGELRRSGQLPGSRVYFHDTHYRAYSEPEVMRALRLEHYDGILSFSPAITEIYQREFGLPHVYTLHEAADPDTFRPLTMPKEQDVVFIGNWGDGDRNEPLESYLLEPSNLLPELRFSLYGVRYHEEALRRVHEQSRVRYRGWVANYRTPLVYAASKMSIHLPRKQYTEAVWGTPTIRVFEVLACGLPLLSLPWPDPEGLFRVGEDYLVVRDQAEMVATMRALADDEAARKKIGQSGRQRILERHTVTHRARQLVEIVTAQ